MINIVSVIDLLPFDGRSVSTCCTGMYTMRGFVADDTGMHVTIRAISICEMYRWYVTCT